MAGMDSSSLRNIMGRLILPMAYRSGRSGAKPHRNPVQLMYPIRPSGQFIPETSGIGGVRARHGFICKPERWERFSPRVKKSLSLRRRYGRPRCGPAARRSRPKADWCRGRRFCGKPE